MVSVNMGSGADDLRSIMAKAGAKIRSDDRLAPGEPNLILYIKLAEHQMKKFQFDTALQSVAEAAEFSPESTLVMLTAARIHALKGINVAVHLKVAQWKNSFINKLEYVQALQA